MRDQLDTQTSDLIPAKRGRPCKHPELGPRTAAQRAADYRSRTNSRARTARDMVGRSGPNAFWLLECSDVQLLEAIRIERAFLDNLVNGPQKGKGAAPSRKRLGGLVAELARRYPVA